MNLAVSVRDLLFPLALPISFFILLSEPLEHLVRLVEIRLDVGRKLHRGRSRLDRRTQSHFQLGFVLLREIPNPLREADVIRSAKIINSKQITVS